MVLIYEPESGHPAQAAKALKAALKLGPPPAERLFLQRKLAALA